MKLLSLLTLGALMTLGACSHHSKKACCKDQHQNKEAMSCTKDDCKKKCCKKEKKCSDGSCTKDAKAKKDKKADCSGDSCHKKS